MKPLLRQLSVTLLGVLSLLPLPAQGSGMRSHQYMSMVALKQLKDGPIKALLSSKEMENRLRNGSYFPDSGYAAKDGYGEIAHWEPFLEQYIQFIRARFKPPFDQGEAAGHVAFLLGVASHGLADQGFDTLMMARSRELDKASMDEFDTANDVFFVKDKNPLNPPEIWVPAADFLKLFLNLGHKVSEETIRRGMSTARLGQLSVRMLVQGNYERMQEKYPWFSSHYLKPGEPGSLEWMGPVIAKYWAVLWRRLNGDTTPDERLVLATVPADGARGVSTDPGSITGRITVLFGTSLLKRSLNEDNLQLTDSRGAAVEIEISHWGADRWANTLKIKPKAALKPGDTYTVTLGKGLTTLHNLSLKAPFRFSFTTAQRKKEPVPDSAPPDTASGEKTAPPGGCSLGRSPFWELWPLLLVAGLLLRLRRASSRSR